jgi:4-hydroxy-4-methyl-2-oxoglutarate aldolase
MSHTPLPDVVRDFDRLPAALIAAAAKFQPAILADVAGRRGALHGRIAALAPSMRCAGTAVTVDVRPGDNLMIHAAMALAKPGDILVVDGKADQTCALMGEIMVTTCRKLGLAGIVLDGAVRDSLELRDIGFPVFSFGTNPNGPTKNVAGRINHPVSVGGVVVNPGDFVTADADGVVVIEKARLAALLPLAEKKVADEAKRIAAIGNGDTRAPWLDTALRAAGVLREGEKF